MRKRFAHVPSSFEQTAYDLHDGLAVTADCIGQKAHWSCSLPCRLLGWHCLALGAALKFLRITPTALELARRN